MHRDTKYLGNWLWSLNHGSNWYFFLCVYRKHECLTMYKYENYSLFSNICTFCMCVHLYTHVMCMAWVCICHTRLSNLFLTESNTLWKKTCCELKGTTEGLPGQIQQRNSLAAKQNLLLRNSLENIISSACVSWYRMQGRAVPVLDISVMPSQNLKKRSLKFKNWTGGKIPEETALPLAF